MKAAPPRRVAEKSFTMRHLWRMALWAGAAAGTLLLAVLASRSDVGSQRVAGLLWSRTDRTQVAARPFDAQAEARRLADAVHGLSSENAQLKSRLAAVEHNVDDITGSIRQQIEAIKAKSGRPDASANPSANPDVNANPSANPDVNNVTPAAEVQRPAQAAAPANSPPSAALLASAAPPVEPPAQAPAGPAPALPSRAQMPALAPPPPAAPAPVAAAEYGVDIGSAISIQVLRARWLGIRSAHAQLLEGLTPVVTLREIPQSDRVELRLVVGPLPNAAAAAKLCAALAPFRLFCRPTNFDRQHVALQ